MVKHYIFLSSSYSLGTRIALDYVLEQNLDFAKLDSILDTIINECGEDVSISTHSILTDSASWDSVPKKDHFFKDVKLIKSLDEFISLIKKDRVIDGLDVATYLLCKIKCTHLKIEKLAYLCFAEYLCKYDKELFKDYIYAYKYGPVVNSIYQKYKGYDNKNISIDSNLTLPFRSRILFAEDGLNKAFSIDETLEKYGNLSASDLVTLTHRKDTPWYVSGAGKDVYKIIDNDTIKQYHCNEMI